MLVSHIELSLYVKIAIKNLKSNPENPVEQIDRLSIKIECR